jgi:cell division protein FtsQ
MELRKGKHLRRPFHYAAKTLNVLLLGVMVLSFVFALNQIKLSDYFPIKNVRVYGVNRVDHKEVQGLLQPLVNRGFFAINVDIIRDRLLQMPWVSDIFVRRNWPDQVDITVIEKNALARWNDTTLLSTSGELFSPKQETYPVDLPRFVGPAGQQVVMLDYFNQMNRLLAPLHAKIAHLELTPYFTWKLTLDNGITLQIGHKDILTRLDHFVRVYPKIVGNRTTDVDYVDLRYPNGVAVRWKTVTKT